MDKNKIKILLVDDDGMMRIYFRDIFWMHDQAGKYEISMTTSLEEAETVIKNPAIKPDIIFLDILLASDKAGSTPAYQMDRSLEFISKMKMDKNLSGIKIVIYSGQKDKTLMDHMLKLGVDGYLVKGEYMPKEIIEFTDSLICQQ